MYISTTSKLCPIQEEFNLPWYSWYPAPLKRYFERRAVTDWPAIANYAKYTRQSIGSASIAYAIIWRPRPLSAWTDSISWIRRPRVRRHALS